MRYAIFMTTTVELSMGTWTRGEDRITACYYDEGQVRLSNSKGEVWVVNDREWLERWDSLRDAGWTRG